MHRGSLKGRLTPGKIKQWRLVGWIMLTFPINIRWNDKWRNKTSSYLNELEKKWRLIAFIVLPSFVFLSLAQVYIYICLFLSLFMFDLQPASMRKSVWMFTAKWNSKKKIKQKIANEVKCFNVAKEEKKQTNRWVGRKADQGQLKKNWKKC